MGGMRRGVRSIKRLGGREVGEGEAKRSHEFEVASRVILMERRDLVSDGTSSSCNKEVRTSW